jgi:hypothetical protein
MEAMAVMQQLLTGAAASCEAIGGRPAQAGREYSLTAAMGDKVAPNIDPGAMTLAQ